MSADNTGIDADPNWFQDVALEWPDSDYAALEPGQRTHSVLIRQQEDLWTYFTRRPGYMIPYVMNKNDPPPVIPPKPLNAGSFKHTMYIPEWTDPIYVPPKHNPDSAFTLRQTLRPAQLVIDAPKNPTPFAKRFGIYPYGTDGRSLLTPTKDFNVTVPVANGLKAFENLPGEQDGESMDIDGGTGNATATRTIPASTLEAEFRDMARATGKPMDELLNELEENLPEMSNDQRATAHAMLNIRVAQDWQAILWGDVTTDELVRDKIFEISDEIPGTLGTNKINPLFERNKWVTSAETGGTAKLPRCMYNVNGKRGEWSPQTDDWLWERMQPLLRYTSRLWEYLTANDPYWIALLNPFNRMHLARTRDNRNEKSKVTYPYMTFSDRPDEHRSGRHWFANKFSEKINGAVETLGILNGAVKLHVTSANHVMDLEPGETVDGMTDISEQFDPETGFPFLLRVVLSVDHMYPLLCDGYSASERMLSIHSMSVTILHELAHAVNHAHYCWLRHPGPRVLMEGSNKRAVEKLALYGRWLYGPLRRGSTNEPFFDDEHFQELGFSMENTVFGGVARSMAEWGGMRWDLVNPMPAGLRLEMWPRGGGMRSQEEMDYYDSDDSTSSLTKTSLPDKNRAINGFSMMVPWRNVAKLQTDEFWCVQVPKYGSAALRLAPDANTKSFNMHTVHSIDHVLSRGDDGQAFADVLSMPMPRNNGLITRFLKMQIAERRRVASLRRRWGREIRPLARRMRKMGAIHCLLRLYLQAAVWYHECARYGPPSTWNSSQTHPASLRCGVIYPEYEKLMQTFNFLVGLHGSSDDASSRPRWLPPKLTEQIKSAPQLRDKLEELKDEGYGQLLRLAKQSTHMVNEIIIVAEAFLAELWKLPGGQRMQVLGEPFKSDMQRVFRSALDKCAEVMKVARATAEADIDEGPLLAHALATTAKVAQLQPIFDDISITPDNAMDMLTCMTMVTKSRRLASDRWLRTARSELLCLNAEDQQRASKVLEWLRDKQAHPTATKVPKPDLAFKSDKEALEDWQRLMDDWEQGGLGARPPGEALGKSRPRRTPRKGGDNDSDDSSGPGRDVFGHFLKRRRGKNEKGLPGAKKQKTTTTEAEGQTSGTSSGTWRKKLSPRKSSSSGWSTSSGKLRLFSLDQLGLRNKSLRHSSSFTDGSGFSDHSTDSPFRSMSPAPGQQHPWQSPLGTPPTPPSLQPMFPSKKADAPATIGMFPHPYALNATITADLALVPPATPRPPPDFQSPMFRTHRSPLAERLHKEQSCRIPNAQELEPGPHYGLRIPAEYEPMVPEKYVLGGSEDHLDDEDDDDFLPGDADDEDESDDSDEEEGAGVKAGPGPGPGPGGKGKMPDYPDGELGGDAEYAPGGRYEWKVWAEDESILTDGSFDFAEEKGKGKDKA